MLSLLGLFLLAGSLLFVTLRQPASRFAAPTAIPTASGPGALAATGGERLPTFTLPALRGGTFNSAALRGKPAVINFFASWCTSCWGEIPAFEAIHRQYAPHGLVVLGIGVLDDADAQTWMVQKLGITYPTVYDERGDVVGGVLRLKVMPTTLFVDRSGTIKSRWQGRLDESILRRELRKIF